jgi:hypothetical protein
VLYDRFGFEWTLLQLSRKTKAQDLVAAAAAAGIDLKVLDLSIDDLRDIFGADLILVRPDQIVAWRADAAHDPNAILGRVLGFHTGVSSYRATTTESGNPLSG